MVDQHRPRGYVGRHRANGGPGNPRPQTPDEIRAFWERIENQERGSGHGQ